LGTLGTGKECASWGLYEKGLAWIGSNKKMSMPEKEWNDFFNVIASAAHCDFVLIDKRWISFLKSTGFMAPDIARYYSKSTVDMFLNDLQSFKTI
jgi:hypothetical protein